MTFDSTLLLSYRIVECILRNDLDGILSFPFVIHRPLYTAICRVPLYQLRIHPRWHTVTPGNSDATARSRTSKHGKCPPSAVGGRECKRSKSSTLRRMYTFSLHKQFV